MADLAVYEDLYKEVAERWMIELYGISKESIPGGIIDEAFKEYLRILREKSHKP